MAQVVFPAVVVPGSTADPSEPVSPSDGQIWVDTDGTAPTTVVTRWSKTPTNGTTTLSGTDDGTTVLAYTPGYEEVFLNGVLLSRGSDYTATTGTSVVLSVATVAGDIVEVICPLQVAYTDAITTTAANAAYVPKTLTTTTGDIIYASAANTPARLGVGSTGNILTVAGGVPTWAAPAGGGANWSLLNSGGTTLTAAATITVSGISSKDKIMVLFKDVTCANASQSIRIQMNTDTGSNYNYYGFKLNWGSTYNQFNLQSAVGENQTGYIVAGTTSDPAGPAFGSVVITGANSSGVKQISSMGAGAADYAGVNAPAYWLGGYYSGSSVISSVSIKTTSGNFTGGTMYVYVSA